MNIAIDILQAGIFVILCKTTLFQNFKSCLSLKADFKRVAPS